MSLAVVLTPDAVADFDSAADWYQEQAGVGTAFTSHVREALDQIRADAAVASCGLP
jgi:hypothetical protein